MERSNGMRPQDVAILLKVALLRDAPWKKIDLADELSLSPAEVGHSLNRSQLAGLISADQRKVMMRSFQDFLFHGFPYVFPVRLGALTIGTPTAYSAPVLSRFFVSDEAVVWPNPEGRFKGQGIEPLYKGAIKASERDPRFYDLLCLLDALRVGRVRERHQAEELLVARLNES